MRKRNTKMPSKIATIFISQQPDKALHDSKNCLHLKLVLFLLSRQNDFAQNVCLCLL